MSLEEFVIHASRQQFLALEKRLTIALIFDEWPFEEDRVVYNRPDFWGRVKAGFKIWKRIIWGEKK